MTPVEPEVPLVAAGPTVQQTGLMPRATVIVVNWNGRRYLDACLAALSAQRVEGGFEILLVDNASTDGSAEHVEERWPEVRLVRCRRNLGFAGGNNLGMRLAAGHHVVLLNSDTAVQPGWLQALIGAIEAHPGVGAVTSKLVFMADPAEIQNAGSLLLSDGSGADRGFHERDQGQYEQREEVFGACGAAVLYRRAMLEDVGHFDETFFNYYEDTDLSWRMRLRGWKVLYEPAALVHHVHAGSSGEWSPFFIFHVDRNRLFMILKNAPTRMLLSASAQFAVLSARNAARALLGRVMRPPEVLTRANLGAGRARIHLRVLLSLLVHLPEMLRKRWSIRRGRRVSDEEISRWLYPRERWAAR